MASAQTLSIANGIKTYDSLTNTVVTMTGRSELHLTSANNPIPGSTVNLNSPDAWVLLPNIRPSVVSASYLGQILVNGAAAILNNNVRLSEYAMGTVIIPHSSSITPLQVFTGPNFLGSSTQLGIYTYYTNNALGAFNRNIASFRLMRGYMATFAQNADGTGDSQVFIAQDGNLDVGMLSANLPRPVSFVRVFPWRWTAKKGWGGSSLITNTAPLWWYDWGNSSVSTVDREYPPMKWNGGSGTSSINSKQNSTHVLGYNEPDSSAQANMTTTAAIADWPTMMKWGLRAGAPAVSDSGVVGQGPDWINSFMSQATNLGYRVDFIPIHWYKCGQSPTQLSNYLASIYQKYKRPMWLTEWNGGASWCSPLPGSPAADATSISNFVNMLESAPFVERYSIYQWFDPSSNLNLLTTNSPPALTPAGVVYLNMPSKVAYAQVLPAGTSRGIAQFHFDNDALDSSGYANNCFVVGDPNYVAGPVNQAIALDGTNSFIQLPADVANGSAFSFAAWIYWNGGLNGQHIFDFGDDTTHYMYLSPSSSGGTFRFAIRNGGSDQILETTALPAGQWMHIAITLSGNTARLYTNGVQAAVSSSIGIAPSSITPAVNFLGKSQSGSDPLFSGNLDEVQIADSVFNPAQIASLMDDSPPQFVTNLIFAESSTQSVAYGSSIAGAAFDSDSGDTLVYSKVSGPAWLNVAADGALSGTPTPSDGGTNIFTVRVMDSAGASAFAGVSINTVGFNANGVWDADASGIWSDTNNWNGGAVANGAGFTADFSTIDITANRTVTLDAARSIGTIKFGDTSSTQSWGLASSGSALTMDTGSGASPSLVVNQNTATISAVLAGVSGLTKSGAGILVLSGNNVYSGNTVIGGGAFTISDSGRLGGGAYSGNITDNGMFNFNSSAAQTLSGVISGSGSLTQASGTVTLSAANTYSGGATINGGTLNLAIGGGTGAIRNNLTINPGATVNLMAGDALGYTGGSPAVYVTNVNIAGGTLNIGVAGNEAYRTTFYLTGGTMKSSGGGSYHFDGTTGASLNSLPSSNVSTVSGGITLRNTGVVFSTAQGSVPGGVDLNISGVIGEQFGSFGFTKSGAGTLALSAVNTNTGPTLVSAGTLLVNGSIKSMAPVTVANLAILGGKGVIYGPVTIQAGGTLAPGTNSASVNTLTISNAVTLQPGSTNRVKIRKTAPTTNDVLLVSGALTYGGTLIVANLAGTLTVGDAFRLFSSPGYAGIFSNIIPATPGSGLLWDTDNLTVDGTLSVILGNATPQFGTVSLDGSNLVFNGSGGVAGTAFSMLASTNLSIPLTNWTVIGSGVFDAGGNFTFTNNWTPDTPHKFFSMKVP